jgi:hypothetical protein
MKTKFILSSVFLVLMVMSIVPLTRAEIAPSHEQIMSNLDFWSGIQYNIDHGLFLFTTEGNSRHCGVWNGESGQPNCAQTFTIDSGSKTFQVSNMCNQCTGNICGLNHDKKCNGGLTDWYKITNQYNYLYEYRLPQAFPVTIYTNGNYAYEVYCCECPVGGCSEPKCTNGDRKNYVCRGNDIWSDYCSNGAWEDKKLKTCSSPQYCSTPEVYDGVCTTCTSSQPSNTCGTDNCGKTYDKCSSGYTCNSGTCESNNNNNNETPGLSGKSISLTQDAWDDATAELVAQAMCKLPGDCSNTEIFNMDPSLTADNYSTTCTTSTTIKETNKNAIIQYLQLKSGSSPWYQPFIDLFVNQKVTDPNSYSQTCASNSLPAILGKISQWFTGTEICKNTLASVPTGTCRATVKATSISYCQYTKVVSFGLFDKNDKCKDGLYTILIGIGVLFMLPLLRPK